MRSGPLQALAVLHCQPWEALQLRSADQAGGGLSSTWTLSSQPSCASSTCRSLQDNVRPSWGTNQLFFFLHRANSRYQLFKGRLFENRYRSAFWFCFRHQSDAAQSELCIWLFVFLALWFVKTLCRLLLPLEKIVFQPYYILLFIYVFCALCWYFQVNLPIRAFFYCQCSEFTPCC